MEISGLVRFFFIEAKVRFLNSVLNFADAERGVEAGRARSAAQPAGLRLTPHSASANLKTEFKKRTFTSIKKKRTKPEISSSCNS